MTKQQLSKRASEILKYLEEKDYVYEGKRYFEVNVKRHGCDDYVDIEKLIREYPKKYQKELTTCFSEEHIDTLYCDWLSRECEYVLEVCESNGNLIASDEDWHKKNVIAKIKARKITAYTNINNLKNKNAKIEEAEKMIVKDKKTLKAFSIIGSEGFVGRMGGHFVFDINEDLGELEEVIDYKDNDLSIQEMEKRLIEHYEGVLEKIDFVKNWVRTFNKSLSWENEIKFEIDNKIDELKSEEDRIAGIKQNIKVVRSKMSQKALKQADELIYLHNKLTKKYD